MALRSGDRLGHYEVLAPLGRGGMGEVYRARDLNLEREVAIKVLPDLTAGEADALSRFEREVRAIAALNHPNILTIHDYGDHEGCRYAVTELLSGETLADRLIRKPMDWREALGIALDVARGLAAAHDKGVIHRDVKPANIFLTDSGAAKVLDFGLARSLDPALVETIEPGRTLPLRTMPGTILGTIGYMSPEQARGEPTDPRSDVFSFGCVLYEMLAGARPFKRDTAADTLAAILNADPPELARVSPDIPPGLAAIVHRCLNKSIDHRFPRGSALVSALNDFKKSTEPSEIHPVVVRRRVNRPLTGLAVIAVLAIVAWILGGSAYRRSREALARKEVLPEIERLSQEGKYVAALRLADQALAVIPDDSKLAELIAEARQPVTVLSTPPGAAVAYKDFDEPDAEWTSLGITPLQNIPVPKGLLRWKIELEGYRPVVSSTPSTAPGLPFNPLDFRLEPEAEAIEGMVHVPSGLANIPFNGFDPLDVVPLPGFHIDIYEVTNAEYQEFVDQRGYTNPDYWKFPFQDGDQALAFEAAMARFVDATGRPGPATWELGRFPAGKERHPVGGVSWYEAAAYAAFRGEQLPTLRQWGRAALSPLEAANPVAPKLVPVSNFGGEATRAAGDLLALSPSGAVNMAGNVREWCLNEEEEGRRYIPGGAWDDPPYMLSLPVAVSPFDRSPKNGFRCARYPVNLPASLTGPIPRRVFRFEIKPPLSVDALQVVGGQYAYPPTPLDVQPVEREESHTEWVRETVSLAAPYGGERMMVRLYLPRGAAPPYQTVVFYPGADLIFLSDLKALEGSNSFETVSFLPRSGRALVIPMYWGTLNRARGRRLGVPGFVEYSGKDLARTLEYLATRDDIDHERMAYAGFSMGATYSALFLPFRPEFRTAVLVSGGMAEFSETALANVPVSSLLPFVRIPVLMLNGSFDYLFPAEVSQAPFFELLGTPAADKRHQTYNAGHFPLPRHESMRETLDWLDKYLGAVSPASPAVAAATPQP